MSECNRGKWHRSADDRCLHRFYSGASGNGEGSDGVSLKLRRRNRGRRCDGMWQKGVRMAGEYE